jgi:SAM-dependent methyltransferase
VPGWKHRFDERAHYSVLAGYALELKPGGALLDAGCGNGVLRTQLHPTAFSTYLGIDFAEAIAQARGLTDDRTRFVAADIRTFEPGERFDTIVFCESLYYIDNAVTELERYLRFLRPGGVFLVSLHRKKGTEELWLRIARRFSLLDRVLITNASDVQWICGAFRHH